MVRDLHRDCPKGDGPARSHFGGVIRAAHRIAGHDSSRSPTSDGSQGDRSRVAGSGDSHDKLLYKRNVQLLRACCLRKVASKNAIIHVGRTANLYPPPGDIAWRVFGETLSSLGMASRSAYTLRPLNSTRAELGDDDRHGGEGSETYEP